MEKQVDAIPSSKEGAIILDLPVLHGRIFCKIDALELCNNAHAVGVVFDGV